MFLCSFSVRCHKNVELCTQMPGWRVMFCVNSTWLDYSFRSKWSGKYNNMSCQIEEMEFYSQQSCHMCPWRATLGRFWLSNPSNFMRGEASMMVPSIVIWTHSSCVYSIFHMERRNENKTIKKHAMQWHMHFNDSRHRQLDSMDRGRRERSFHGQILIHILLHYRMCKYVERQMYTRIIFIRHGDHVWCGLTQSDIPCPHQKHRLSLTIIAKAPQNFWQLSFLPDMWHRMLHLME